VRLSRKCVGWKIILCPGGMLRGECGNWTRLPWLMGNVDLLRAPARVGLRSKYPEKHSVTLVKDKYFFLLGLWPLLLFVLLSAAVTTTERSAVSGLVTVTLSKVPCAPLWYRSTQLGDEKSNARKEQVAYFSIFPMKNRPGTYVSSENRSSESVH